MDPRLLIPLAVLTMIVAGLLVVTVGPTPQLPADDVHPTGNATPPGDRVETDGAGDGTSEDSSPPEPTGRAGNTTTEETGTGTPEIVQPPYRVNPINLQVVEGNGSASSNRRPASGLGMVHATYEGSGPFRVDHVDGSGATRKRLIETSGRWRGTVAFRMGAGENGIDVTTTGPWRLVLSQPRPQEGRARPDVDVTGRYSRVFGPFQSKGLIYQVRYVQPTKADATVYAIDLDGEKRVLFDGQGPVQIDRSYTYLPIHYLAVDTDSERWRLRLSV